MFVWAVVPMHAGSVHCTLYVCVCVCYAMQRMKGLELQRSMCACTKRYAYRLPGYASVYRVISNVVPSHFVFFCFSIVRFCYQKKNLDAFVPNLGALRKLEPRRNVDEMWVEARCRRTLVQQRSACSSKKKHTESK